VIAKQYFLLTQVLDVKNHIFKAYQYEISLQKLIFKGKILSDDTCSVKSLQFTDKDFIVCMVSKPKQINEIVPNLSPKAPVTKDPPTAISPPPTAVAPPPTAVAPPPTAVAPPPTTPFTSTEEYPFLIQIFLSRD
jgi:UV excision repair protein RAD23